jgi:NADH pyrophosphatase NudC (nudix superfamily)
MPYLYELGTGQRIYLDYQGTQTLITAMNSRPGQQQQSSCGLAIGSWTAAPEMFQSADGAVLRLQTAQGKHFIQIQGTSISVMAAVPSLSGFRQVQGQQIDTAPVSSMPPMQPMSPMQPMKMGDMQMSLNPMEMRMGNMAMQMNTSASATSSSASNHRFCSQCGVAVTPIDRFCSNCGHPLG